MREGHGLLGLLQQFLRGLAVLGEQGDTDGGAQAHLVLVDLERRFQAVEDALRQFGRLVGLLDVGLDQGELVAAQARQRTEPRAVPAQAVGEGDQQLVAELVGVLLVDPLEIVEAQAQHCHPALLAAGAVEDLVELLLQQLAVRQAGEEVVLGNAQQVVFGLAAQVAVAFDRGEQLVGGGHPEPQLVAFVPLEQRQLVLAGAVGIDADQVFDDLRQRLGQHPVVDQEQHQAHGQGAENAGDEDDFRSGDEVLAVGRGVQGDLQVAVVFAIGRAADQSNAEGAFLAEDRVGQPARRQVQQRPGFLRQHRLAGMADARLAHRLVLEQAFEDLHRHFPVEAVDRLGGRVADHREDALGVAAHRLLGLVGVEDDLRATEHYANGQRRQ